MINITIDEIKELIAVADEKKRDLSISMTADGDVDIAYEIPTGIHYTSNTYPMIDKSERENNSKFRKSNDKKTK